MHGKMQNFESGGDQNVLDWIYGECNFEYKVTFIFLKLRRKIGLKFFVNRLEIYGEILGQK